MAAFYNWPKQKIHNLLLYFSALAIIFLFCHCFASEVLFWLYQMRLELKVYSLPAKIFFSLHWGCTLVINLGFPVCVTRRKEETWRTGVSMGQQTSSRTPTPAAERRAHFSLWCCQDDNSTGIPSRPRGAPESWEAGRGKSAVLEFRTSRNRSHRTSRLLLGRWEGPAVLRLSGHLIHAARHTGSLFMEVKSLFQAVARPGCKHFLSKPSGMWSEHKTIPRSYLG